MSPTDRRQCLVTGANRGLGLEFVRQLLANGDYVIGACRSPDTSGDLQRALGHENGRTVQLDVADSASIAAAASDVGRDFRVIDLLVNVAGVEDSTASSGPVDALEAEALLRVFTVNIVAPALVTGAFAPMLARSDNAVVGNLTSRRELLDQPVNSGNIGYAISKAGLNMLTAKLAAELRDVAITVVALSPGWVRTDMGGPEAPLTAQQSVASMLGVIKQLDLSRSGAILGHDGTNLFTTSHDRGTVEPGTIQ